MSRSPLHVLVAKTSREECDPPGIQGSWRIQLPAGLPKGDRCSRGRSRTGRGCRYARYAQDGVLPRHDLAGWRPHGRTGARVVRRHRAASRERVYSPYGGPATVTFTFEAEDSGTIFTVRIREPGHGTIKEKDYLVDPATQTSPHSVSFSWRELSVAAPTDYVVDVRRQDGGPVITSETFTVSPKLVSGLSAKPSPFYPLVQDGYKDRTRIGFSLAADTVETVVHVFRDDIYGRCCGTEIQTEDLGPLTSGAYGWTWDGTEVDASFASKGTYFARVEANAVSGVSKAQKVEVTKGLTAWLRGTTRPTRPTSCARRRKSPSTGSGGWNQGNGSSQCLS